MASRFNNYFLGAGLQSQSRFNQYRETIKRACLTAVKALNNGKDAAEAACIAVAVLEVNNFVYCRSKMHR